MSRHSRHRPGDQRRPGPTGRTDVALPPRPGALAGSESGRALLAPVESQAAPEVAVGVSPAIAMAALQPPTAASSVADEAGIPASVGCTPAQLRRFIKSRAYLPVHEIRRRFGIESADDDVTGFDSDAGRVFVGLPQREGRILGELVRTGEVGYELQLDPEAPIIVGVYPMRPVIRQ